MKVYQRYFSLSIGAFLLGANNKGQNNMGPSYKGQPHLVGAGRLELPTSCTPSKRASQTAPRPVANNQYNTSISPPFQYIPVQRNRSSAGIYICQPIKLYIAIHHRILIYKAKSRHLLCLLFTRYLIYGLMNMFQRRAVDTRSMMLCRIIGRSKS